MSENEQLETALKQCEEKFAQAFQNSPLVITVTSAIDHRYIDVNKAFERISGWKRDEVIGRTPFDIGVWVDSRQRLDFVRRLLAGETIRDVEVQVRLRNGEFRTISGSASLIQIGGETCVLSIIADITSIKEAENAKRLAQTLSSTTRKLIQAQDEERAGIVRDLDRHMNSLTLVSVGLHRMLERPRQSDSERESGIIEARLQIHDLVKDIHSVSERLHFWTLEYFGLTTAAAKFCEQFSVQCGVKVAFVSEPLPADISKEISICLMHVLKEGLQNLHQTSGPQDFEVLLSTESNHLHLVLRAATADSERTLEASEIGLTIARERLKIVGGELWTDRTAERGAIIHARIPIKRDH